MHCTAGQDFVQLFDGQVQRRALQYRKVHTSPNNSVAGSLFSSLWSDFFGGAAIFFGGAALQQGNVLRYHQVQRSTAAAAAIL